MKSTRELRAFLVEQMEGIASGEIDAERAKGVGNMAQQVYNTINLEMKMARAKAQLGDTFKVEPVEFS